MKKIFISISIVVAFASCGDQAAEISAKEGEVFSSVSSGSKTDAELAKELEEFERQEAERREKEAATKTTMEFDKKFHDFGNVKQGSENTTTFVVRNTGDKPLIISDVSASCGCTLPKKPEEPIAPGKEDVITVVFKPKPSQKNEIKKTVTVTANTEPAVEKVEIRAFVEE